MISRYGRTLQKVSKCVLVLAVVDMNSDSGQLFTVAGFAKKKPYLAIPVSRQLPPPLSSFYFGRGICILPTEYI